MIGSGDDRILEIERSSRYKKYKERAHVVGVKSKISQLSLEISRVLIPCVNNEVRNLGEGLCDVRGSPWLSFRGLV
jgi:hypothetical protein